MVFVAFFSLNAIYFIINSGFIFRIFTSDFIWANWLFDLNVAKEEVIKLLKDLLVLTDNEKKYLIVFLKGNFDPYHLFKPNDAERTSKHPMAKWRVASLKK